MLKKITITVLLFATAALAQKAPAPVEYTLEEGTQQFGVWGAVSAGTPQWIGVTYDRRLTIAAFRYAYVFYSGEKYSARVTSDLIPSAWVSEPNGQSVFPATGPRVTTWGGGAAPLGFQVNARNGKRLQPFWSLSGGVLYFSKRQVPVPDSSHFNFTFDTGLGVELFQSPKKSWMFGYRFHHISNAESGNRNPGIDSHLLYVGFSFFK